MLKFWQPKLTHIYARKFMFASWVINLSVNKDFQLNMQKLCKKYALHDSMMEMGDLVEEAT